MCPDRRRVVRLVASSSSTAAALTSAFGFGFGFVDVERSAVNIFPVDCANRIVSFGIVRHLDEAKSSRLTRIPVCDDVDTINTAVSFKQCTDVLLGGLETEVPNENVVHSFSF